MSGATIESLETELFILTLSTPCINFAVDPVTGHSPEQEYHRQASREFRERLERVREPMVQGLEGLRARFAGRVELVPYDGRLPEVHDWNVAELRAQGSGPCRLGVIAGAAAPGVLEICLASLPDDDLREELAAAVKAMVAEAFG